ncbi:MAG TPA: hypothetical protein VMW50_03285 [Dehalococcoidia bacterium]|nr:hypothetical protein [Dehalococcoidia bacterium]
MSEYNRKESTKIVGELYPVLVAKDGQVIDGFHRLEDNPDWKTETLEHIDSEEKLLLARAISNWHRREIPRTEKEKWINGLAKIYQKQGLKIKGSFPFKNEIVEKLVEVTALTQQTVNKYLVYEFKQPEKESLAQKKKPTIPASQRIETALGSDYVERHETEVLEKALKDPDFIVKAIEKAPEVLSPKRVTVVDRQGYHKPTIERTAKREVRERAKETEEERETFKASPAMRDKSRLLKAWRSLSVILASSKDLVCPICGGEAEAILRCQKCGEIPLSEAQRIAQEAVQ